DDPSIRAVPLKPPILTSQSESATPRHSRSTPVWRSLRSERRCSWKMEAQTEETPPRRRFPESEWEAILHNVPAFIPQTQRRPSRRKNRAASTLQLTLGFA